ncbi:MAG: hypothetical protein ACKO6K_04615 [Chitinophagaceae bacterium]
MKKDFNTIQYGIFIDHKKAVVVSIDEKNQIATESLKAPLTSLHFKGEKTTKTGMLGKTVNRQKKQQNQTNLNFRKFCKTVAGQLKKANQIYIFGPADAKYALQNEIEKRKSLSAVYLKVAKAAPMVQKEVIRTVKKYYKF